MFFPLDTQMIKVKVKNKELFGIDRHQRELHKKMSVDKKKSTAKEETGGCFKIHLQIQYFSTFVALIG